jgi:hypothetical protein
MCSYPPPLTEIDMSAPMARHAAAGRVPRLSAPAPRWAAAAAGLAVASLVVVQASSAAFTSTTTRPGNTWTTGTVVVTADSAGTALFSQTALAPDTATTHDGEKCLVVTYSGSLAAEVRLHAAKTAGSTGLEPYLDVVIERGTGTATDGVCGSFVSSESVFTGNLGTLTTNHTGFGTGLVAGGWQPTPPSTNMTSTYRVRWNLQDNNNAQGKTAEVSLSWEAQNT